jgi:hypothetical protein
VKQQQLSLLGCYIPSFSCPPAWAIAVLWPIQTHNLFYTSNRLNVSDSLVGKSSVRQHNIETAGYVRKRSGMF